MSRRRQRTTGSILAASDSDDDAIISTSAPASSHGARLNPRPAPLERRSRARVAPPLSADDARRHQARQWHRDRLQFGLPDFLTGLGLGPFFALLGIPGAHGDGPVQRMNLAEHTHMQLFRPEMSSTDKRHLIDATTIVCTHNSADELQCGICLQTLDQGTQLRMAQYVERCKKLRCVQFCNTFCMCCHKFHDECLTEWFKVIPFCFVPLHRSQSLLQSHLDCPQCRVKLSEMMDSMKSVESGGKFSSCSRAMGSRERVLRDVRAEVSSPLTPFLHYYNVFLSRTCPNNACKIQPLPSPPACSYSRRASIVFSQFNVRGLKLKLKLW